MKKSIIIHEDTTELFKGLDDASAGALLKALLAYQNGDDVSIDDPVLGAVFAMLKVKLDKDNADYEARCQKNSESARKRWDANACDCTQTDADACERMQTDAQKDNNRITTGLQQDKQKRESKRFAPPSVNDVQEYCEEKGYQIDPEAFVDFYAAKGWKVGNQPMKDWKAAVRTWTRRETSAPPGKPKAEYHNRYNDFPQRDNDYDKIQEEWIRKSFGAPLPVAGRS